MTTDPNPKWDTAESFILDGGWAMDLSITGLCSNKVACHTYRIFGGGLVDQDTVRPQKGRRLKYSKYIHPSTEPAKWIVKGRVRINTGPWKDMAKSSIQRTSTSVTIRMEDQSHDNDNDDIIWRAILIPPPGHAKAHYLLDVVDPKEQEPELEIPPEVVAKLSSF